MTLDTNEKIEFGFAELGLPANIVNAVTDLGFANATPIQVQAIPLLLQKRDILGLASTGSGKTASFMLPLLANLDAQCKDIQILVLSPTRELAVQVATATNSFLKYTPNVTCLPIYGGQKYEIQTRALRRGVQIVVATPGRLVDLLTSKNINFDNLKAVVLDEADEMLSMGFADDLEKILKSVPSNVQTALFSATMPASIERLTTEYLKNPEIIKIKKDKGNEPKIEQNYWIVQGYSKNQGLIRFLEIENYDAAIIFTKTKSAADEVCDLLQKNKFSVAVLHGDISQNVRENTLDALRRNRLNILVATDVAARGLDIDRIDLVINYDMPGDNESYVHRVGRTGRAGREGKSITFVTEKELRNLYFLEKEIKKQLNEIEVPNNKVLVEYRIQEFKKLLETKLNDHRLEQYQHLVEEIIPTDYEPEQVLAALINLATTDCRLLLPEEKQLSRRIKYDPSRFSKKSPQRNSSIQRESFGTNGFTQYVTKIGKNQNIQVRDILAAVSAVDYRIKIGKIKIFNSFTTIELPDDLPKAQLSKLSTQIICNTQFNLEVDTKKPSYKKFNNDTRGGSNKYNSSSKERRHRSHNESERRNDGFRKNNRSLKPTNTERNYNRNELNNIRGESNSKKSNDTRSTISDILSNKVSGLQKELSSIKPQKIFNKVKDLLKSKD